MQMPMLLLGWGGSRPGSILLFPPALHATQRLARATLQIQCTNKSTLPRTQDALLRAGRCRQACTHHADIYLRMTAHSQRTAKSTAHWPVPQPAAPRLSKSWAPADAPSSDVKGQIDQQRAGQHNGQQPQRLGKVGRKRRTCAHASNADADSQPDQQRVCQHHGRQPRRLGAVARAAGAPRQVGAVEGAARLCGQHALLVHAQRHALWVRERLPAAQARLRS